LGSDSIERERLQGQSEALRAATTTLLNRLGVEPGWNAIDLGCGPQGVIELLVERVGHTGSVTGLDFDPINVGLARRFVQDRGWANVEIVEGDARHTGLPSSSFDLVHARTLLINVSEPAGIVEEMVRLAVPGGVVAAMDPDTGITFCHPPLAEWDRMTEIFRESYRLDGADSSIGRRLPELFRNAGLVDVEVEALAEVYPYGHARRMIRADLVRTMRPKILARAISNADELEALDRAVRTHLADPRVVVMPSLLFLAWGRKPIA
jgi:ubiquinone/menaquinone biosynthesis C-methylase UbiE